MTADTPRVLICEYIRVHGPSKVTAITAGTGLSETTARKHLKDLEAQGNVVKDGQHWTVVNHKLAKPKAKQAREDGTRRDPDVEERDEMVFCHLKELPDDEWATRNKVAAALGLPTSRAYLSLWRLAKADRIEQVESGTREPGWRVKA